MAAREWPRDDEDGEEAPLEGQFPLDDATDNAAFELTEATNDEGDDLDDAELGEDASLELQEAAAVTAEDSEESAVESEFEPEAELQVPAIEALEEALMEPPEERVPPLILVSAVIGLVVGLFVWGSLAISVISSAGGVVADLSDSEGAFAVEAANLVFDCGDGEAPGFLSAEQRAAFEARCVSPTPVSAGETPVPDPALNREDCDEIRGTEYRSVEEREWFLENCLEG